MQSGYQGDYLIKGRLMHTVQSPCSNTKHSLEIIRMQQWAAAPLLLHIRSGGVVCSHKARWEKMWCLNVSVENTFYSVEAISVGETRTFMKATSSGCDIDLRVHWQQLRDVCKQQHCSSLLQQLQSTCFSPVISSANTGNVVISAQHNG